MIFRKYEKIYTVGNDENKNLFSMPDVEVVIEEKVDGANFRFYINEHGEIIFGSRSQQLSEDKEHKFAKNFERCIKFLQQMLYGKDLSKYHGMVFYGECMVRHTMAYDWEKIPAYLGFDINNESNPNYPKRFLPYPQVKEIFDELGLSFVPVIKICKVSEIGQIDDSLVPVSAYPYPSGNERQRLAEGIVIKKYSWTQGSEEDVQIMAKYVRAEFKEDNAVTFGSRKGTATEDDTGELVFKYCTNARIEKIVFKLIDEGEKLDMTMMHKLPKRVLKDITEEHWSDIFESHWAVDFRKLRQLVPKRCASILNQMIVNNNLK